jgi:hypothetical protein
VVFANEGRFMTEQQTSNSEIIEAIQAEWDKLKLYPDLADNVVIKSANIAFKACIDIIRQHGERRAEKPTVAQ